MSTTSIRRLVVRGAAIIAAVGVAAGLVGAGPRWSRGIRQWDRHLLGQASSAPREAIAARRTEEDHRTSGGARAVRLMRPLQPGLVLGYLYDPAATAEAMAQLKALVPTLTGIAADWYSINSVGQLSGQTQPQVMQFASRYHLLTLAVVEQTNSAVLGALLQSSSAALRAQNEMLTMVESDGFNGVNLDWEGIPAPDRNLFTQFVRQLSTLFHDHGYYVTLSLPPETGNSPENSWTGAYNYKALGQAADLLMVMAYDQHWSGGPPGPIASTSWVRSVLSYSVSAVPADKVVLGIPGYGYDWAGEGAVALTFAQAEALEEQYAPSSTANHFQYVQDGVLHSVWFENTASFLSKINLVAGYQLRGIVLWRIGIEDPSIWDFLE